MGIYSNDLDREISSNLGITLEQVKVITKAYRNYLRYCLNKRGLEATYLGLVAIRFGGKKPSLTKETTAYQISVIAKELNINRDVVERVLGELRKLHVNSLTPGIAQNVRGLFTLATTEEGIKLSKSTLLNPGIRVSKTALFRKVAEGYK